MTRKVLIRLIAGGESLNVEFKQRFSEYKKIAKELIAFANTSGGVLIFGVDDDGSIYGVESEKQEAELVKETAAKYCEPPVEIDLFYVEIDGLEVVAVVVAESVNKPHRIQDYKTELDLNSASVYVRVNDKSIPASKEMIKLLQTQTAGMGLKNYKIGKSEKAVFDFLSERETISVKELAKAVNISNRRASRTLINLVRANMLNIHSKDNGENYFTAAGDINSFE